MTHLHIPYSPRRVFLPYHENRKRFGVTVAHRRCGKTVARVNRTIKAAVENTRKSPHPRYAYVAPFFVQAKDIAWGYFKMYCDPLIQFGAKVNEGELSITLPHNGAVIRLYGMENAQRMRGLYFDGIALDEAQDTPRHVLTQIMLPCLSDFKGWLDIAGTPKGWANLLGEVFKLSKKRPDEWFHQILKASETGIIDEEELRAQRMLMSENEYDQEFECDFDAAITGAVYGKQMSTADKENRIGKVKPIEGIPVHTAWDLGYDDATAIWFFQILGSRELHIVGYIEESNQDIAYHCEAVHKWFRQHKIPRAGMGQHYVPHDAAHKLLAAGGRSIIQQAWQYGIAMRKVDATSQQNSIEAARKTLEYCWFDEIECEIGLDALRQYQFKFDNDKKIFQSKPQHDWSSHACDAFEIIGQVWRAPRAEEVENKKGPRFLNDLTAAEVFDLEGKYTYTSPYGEDRI